MTATANACGISPLAVSGPPGPSGRARGAPHLREGGTRYRILVIVLVVPVSHLAADGSKTHTSEFSATVPRRRYLSMTSSRRQIPTRLPKSRAA